MKYFFTILVCCFSIVGVTQNTVELPYVDGKIRYDKSVKTQLNKQKSFDKMRKRIAADVALKVLRIDKETFTIYASGNYKVPSKRAMNDINYLFTATAKDGVIQFSYHSFYMPEIGKSVEELVELNKNSERKTVQENLKYIKAGIHSRVASHSAAFKQYIKAN